MQKSKFLSHIKHLEEAAAESGGSHWLLITGIIVGSLVLLAGLIYGYFKYRQYKVYVEYSQRPEDGIPRESIGILQRNKFRFWKIFEEKGQPIQEVQQQQKENYYGKFIELRFKGKANDILTIRGEKPLAKEETSYFEIEIEDNPRNSDIVIGFCSSKEYQKQLSLGLSQTSVGFRSSNGQVLWKSQVHQDHKFSAVYGETLGIGFRQSDGRVWFSYNGKFLNPPPPSEAKKKVEEDKKAEEKKEDEDSEIDMELIERNKKIEQERKAMVLAMGEKLEIYPAISVDGPCKINLNIGGMQFRMNQKELKQGLLH